MMDAAAPSIREVAVGPHRLNAILSLPDTSRGIILFAHGSGSGRLSPRNSYVARALNREGFATLLLDLLTTAEERDRSNVFDIPLLAGRLAEATEWTAARPETEDLPIGYFGASTGGGAALVAAAKADGRIVAVVSRGGRPDLAGSALPLVKSPTLLIVGGNDHEVIRLNEAAARHLNCPHELLIVPGAGHLFEEPGTLDAVVSQAVQWFSRYMPARA